MMMSALNRLVVILLALAVLAGAVIAIGVSLHALSPDVLGGWFEPQLDMAFLSPVSTRVAVIGLAVIVAAAMIGLLVSETLPVRSSFVHTLSVTDEGTATIENDSLCLLAERTGETVHGVLDLHCYIRERNGSLVIRGNAAVALGASLLEINPEMKSRICQSMQQLTGLKVNSVDIKFRYQTDKRGSVSVR